MDKTCKLIQLTLVLALCSVRGNAGYTETMIPMGTSRNLRTDYGLVDDDAKADQSATFQSAIDDLATAGGGRLIVPKGTYRLARIRLKSNIHLLIEAGTVFKCRLQCMTLLRKMWPAKTEGVP